MAKILDLQATARTVSGTAAVKRLRKAGRIPAVIYGKKHETSGIELDEKTFRTILSSSASDNILVNLQVEGEKGEALALVQEVQHDYLRGGILHVDFHAVAADEDIHADIPIVVQNADLAEKKGGQLDHILHSLQIHCLPKDLPETFTVDVSVLNIGEAIHVKDLDLGKGVRTSLDGDLVVAILKEPTVSETPAAPAAPAKK